MKNLVFGSVLCVVGVVPWGLVGCDSSSGSVAEGPTPTPVEVPAGGDAGSPEPSCPTHTTGPTVHEGDVEQDEVWTAETGPHVVEANVNVRNGKKLTIEPCVEVRMAAGTYLQVAFPGTPNTGSLIAEGTEKRPIRIVGEGGARWASLAVHAPGTARLAHVFVEGGGGGDFQDHATLAVYGDGEDGSDPAVFVDHVTISKSLGTGAWFQRGATFIAGSRDLTIKESGGDEFPYPIQIEEHTLDSLPSGSYTGNKKDEILIQPGGGQVVGEGLIEDGTMHDRGIPYHFGRFKSQNLVIGGRADGKLVTLTIEAGVMIRFMEGSALKVQSFTTNKPATAALRALGTADKPIVLTSANASPKAGDWLGIWFGGVPSSADVIDHVRIEDAGYDCGCILNTCSAITEHEGAIIFTAQPPSAFVTNTVFSNIAGHGVTQGYDGAFVDFRPTNTFEAVSGCAQTRPRDPSTSCPSPKPACD